VFSNAGKRISGESIDLVLITFIAFLLIRKKLNCPKNSKWVSVNLMLDTNKRETVWLKRSLT